MQKIGLISLVVLLLGGCASVASQPTDPSVDQSLAALISVAEEVAESNREANMILSAGNNSSLAVKYDFTLSGLPEVWMTEIPLLQDWNGGLTGFIEIVSKMGGLNTPVIIGRRPPVTTLINIPKGRRTLIDFLADAGFQGGSGVNVSPLLKQDRVQISFTSD